MGRRGRQTEVRQIAAAAAAAGAVILSCCLAVTTIASALGTEVTDGASIRPAVSEYAGFASPVQQMQFDLDGAGSVKFVVVPESVRQGVNSPRDPLVLASMELENGLYELGFELPLTHDRAFSTDGSLECQFVEATSGVPLLPQDPVVVAESREDITVQSSVTLALPAMTVELRCAPEVAALSRTEVGDVTLYAIAFE
ncbi:hypothetical protein [Marisediminicola sp. LYQ134]|uniref:hypothetical protein n=1 Tax=Marisediminicola sp. LYQ134 TaxID=3391061 RepID=UPI003982ECD6